MNPSRVLLAAVLIAGINSGANAQQQTAASPKQATAAAQQDCVRTSNKKHEHGEDRGTGKHAMQPCAPAKAASEPASKLRKTHDSRKN